MPRGQDSSQQMRGRACVHLAMFCVHLRRTRFYLSVTQVHMSFCLSFHYVYNHVQCLQLHVHVRVFIPSCSDWVSLGCRALTGCGFEKVPLYSKINVRFTIQQYK